MTARGPLRTLFGVICHERTSRLTTPTPPTPSSRRAAVGTSAAAAFVLAVATFVCQERTVASGPARKVVSRQEFLPLRVWKRGSGGQEVGRVGKSVHRK